MHGTLQLVLILLATAVFATVVFRRAGLPSMLAYLAIGALIGPHGGGWVPDRADARYLAEFGVVFLMFTIGLEFNLRRLNAMRSTVIGLGGAQVVTSIVLVVGGAGLAGLDWRAATALGAVLAMSSTAIVSKLLAERGELHSHHGRQSLALLLFQDLAVVPLLILIPALGSAPEDLAIAVGVATLKAAAVLGIVLFFGQRLMRWWVHLVAEHKSSELFMLNVLLMTLGLAYVTELAGLSLALGAFLAGMLISETGFRYQVEADIKPFRDVLLGLFFVTVGMSLDMGIVFRHGLAVMLVLAGMLSLKLMTIAILARRVSGEDWSVAWRTAIYTAQAGEFGFVLLNLADAHHAIPPVTLQVVLAAMVLSMLLAPLMIHYSERLMRGLPRAEARRHAHAARAVAAAAGDLAGHVILCGFGRTGRHLARVLEQEKIPCVALDLDPRVVREAAAEGARVVFGDASRREVLLAAGLKQARALVITYADTPAALKILHRVRQLQPGLPTLVRTSDDRDLDRLKEAGAVEVVPEVLEASLMIASQMLLVLEVPLRRVLGHVTQARRSRYALLRGFALPEAAEIAGEIEGDARVRPVGVWAGSPAVGLSLVEANFSRFGVVVSSLRRDGRDLVVEAGTRLATGDLLMLAGEPEGLAAAEAYLTEREP